MKRAIALIPCYNSRKYIRTAVQSLLNQTRRLDLIVVLDDCSNDGFEQEIQDLMAKHDNLIIHKNPRNLGRSGCRNEGLDNYEADYYFLNDADDVSLPNRVENTINFMEKHPTCGVCGGYVEYIDCNGKIFGKGTQMYCLTEKDSQRYREGLTPLGLFCSSVCLRGDVIKNPKMRFDTELEACEDMDLWNLILENGWDVLCIQEYLSQYRFHDESICTTKYLHVKYLHKYVEDRIARRRSNLPAINYDEYYASLQSKGAMEHLRFKYPIYAEYFYRTGGFHCISKRYIRGGFMLLMAFLMEPWRIRRMIYQRLGKKL